MSADCLPVIVLFASGARRTRTPACAAAWPGRIRLSGLSSWQTVPEARP